METIIKTGWRIYDPAEKTLDDEFSFIESLAFNGRGSNPLAAVAALTGWKEAVKQVSRKAGQLWERETLNPKRRIAGRACYNMAIINEIDGNMDKALEWAQKAWEDYKIRRSLDYCAILEDRINQAGILSIQESD